MQKVCSLFYSSPELALVNSCVNLYACCSRLVAIQNIFLHRIVLGGFCASLCGVAVALLSRAQVDVVQEHRMYFVLLAISFSAYVCIPFCVFLTACKELACLYLLRAGCPFIFWKAMQLILILIWALIAMYDGFRIVCDTIWTDTEDNAYRLMCSFMECIRSKLLDRCPSSLLSRFFTAKTS